MDTGEKDKEDLENRFDEFKEPLEELSPADKNQKKIARTAFNLI